MTALAALPNTWRAKAGEMRRFGATPQADAVEACAEELEQVVGESETEASPASIPVITPTEDQLLTVDEAAKILGVDRTWLYRHADTLPFTRRLTAGTLRFSSAGLQRWVATR